jgi:hypothetical protein
MFPAFAALPGLAGGGGGIFGGGGGGPVTAGDATNRGVNVSGGIGGGADGVLNNILNYAAGGPPGNGGMGYYTGGYNALNVPNPNKAQIPWVPIAIGVVGLVAVIYFLRK